jgi:hypothetical protein
MIVCNFVLGKAFFGCGKEKERICEAVLGRINQQYV